jgi:BCD family chlorophyll transporter-like MFS transporter
MAVVGIVGSLVGGGRAQAMRRWTTGGCLCSALALLGLAVAGMVGPGWPLRGNLALLGVANGAFAVAAIGAMMGLAGVGRASREGTRMGLWGAAQAVAMGAGGLLSSSASDIAHALLGTPALAYAAVFAGQAALFLVAAKLAGQVFAPRAATSPAAAPPPGTGGGRTAFV